MIEYLLTVVIGGLFLAGIICGLCYGGVELFYGRRDALSKLRREVKRDPEARAVYKETVSKAHALLNGDPSTTYDESVLLGPVSAWVAEGEARAVYEWTAERSTGKKPIILGPPAEFHPRQPDCGDCEWEELHSLELVEPVGYVRIHPCGVCPATRDPDLPWPMRDARFPNPMLGKERR